MARIEDLVNEIDEVLDEECKMSFPVDFNNMKCSICGEIIKTDFNPIMPVNMSLLPHLFRAVQIDHYINNHQQNKGDKT